MGLVNTRSRKQAAEGCADVLAFTQPDGFGLRSILPVLPSVILGSGGMVTGVEDG